jgi:hypothetical protein
LVSALRRSGDAPAFAPRPVAHPGHDDRRGQPRRLSGQRGTLWYRDASNDRQLESVSVVDSSAKGFGIESPRPLAVGQGVWVELTSGPTIKAVVRHCYRIGPERFRVGLYQIQSERRRVDRQPVCGSGRLEWYGPLGRSAGASAVVRNASEFGLQLVVSEKVPLGQIARLSGESLGCMGTVCYCLPCESEFLVGLHFTQDPYEAESLDYRE